MCGHKASTVEDVESGPTPPHPTMNKATTTTITSMTLENARANILELNQLHYDATRRTPNHEENQPTTTQQ